MNEVVPLLAALTLGGRGPLQTLAGTLAPPGVRWGRRGVQDVGAGRGMLRACLNRTHRRLPACLPLRPLVWVGRAKMKKKMCRLLTGLLGQAGHTQEEGEARRRQGDPSEAGLGILLLIPFVNTSWTLFNSVCTDMGTLGRQITLA